MNKITRTISNLLKSFDLFPNNQFIKYNKQSQFTTATGGFVSLALIIFILILFSSKGIQTVSKAIVTSTVSTIIDTEPPSINITTDQSGGFMFAIGVYGLNLNDPNITYFSVSLFQNTFSPIFQPISNTPIPMVPCTKDHFKFNKDTIELFHRLNLTYCLCPPLGYKFEIGGRVTSAIYKQISINVQPCNTGNVSNCANSTVLSNILSSQGSFTLTVPIINTIVNANDQDYLKVYIEDRNYFSFTPTLGVRAAGYIERYQIDTDISIMPYTTTSTDYVTTVPDLLSVQNLQLTGSNQLYAQISFSKSSRSSTYTRSFNKIDGFFSYIGGLIGSALGAFFIMKSFSQKAFLLDLASKLVDPPHYYLSHKKFNFFHSIGISIKLLLEKICIRFSWERGEYYIKSMQEMDEQLDVCLILKKIAFLEQVVSVLLGKHQLETICLKGKKSLESIEQARKKLNLQKVLVHANANEITNEELINEFSSDKQSNQQQMIQRIKMNLTQVIRQSKQKNKVSKQILSNIGQSIIEKCGLMQQGEENIIQNKSDKKSIKQSIKSEIQAKMEQNSIKNGILAKTSKIQMIDFEYLENQ